MRINRTGSAEWTGGVKDGLGAISTESGALSAYPYGFGSRFEGSPGSNPEELIGAAHSACFTMALALMLSEAGLRADKLDTAARVTLEQSGGQWAITAVHLTLTGVVPGAEEIKFRELAEAAKAGCPVSKLLKADVTLEVDLRC